MNLSDDFREFMAGIESLKSREQQLADKRQAITTMSVITAEDELRIQSVREGLDLVPTGPRAGKPAHTLRNFTHILRSDSVFVSSDGAKFSSLRINTRTDTPEIEVSDQYTQKRKFIPVSRGFCAEAVEYIERYYELRSKDRLEDEILIVARKRPYDPIRSVLASLKWDGIPRIADFLTRWARAGESDYVREVSRLLFATGIHRAMNPGCDIEGAIVFVSPVQGCGKSTLCKWLSLGLYTSLASIEGRESAENICGKWLVELEELKALQGRFTNDDSIKRFITLTDDYFRAPYDRAATSHPRSCFFIGTTNASVFLTDPTGNRRFFPIEFRQNIEQLQSRADECKHEIEQCWAEAYAKLDSSEMNPWYARELLSAAEEVRSAATIEDNWAAYVEYYLEGARTKSADVTLTLTPDRKPAVCLQLIYNWIDARFGACDSRSYSPQKDGTRISAIIDKVPGWERGTNPLRLRFPIQGKELSERYWFYNG